MLELLTAEEMGRADRLTIEGGVPGAVLMENAGRGVADLVSSRFPDAPTVAVLCGPGNNGGDGFVAARHLLDRGYRVRLGFDGDPAKLPVDAAAMAARGRGGWVLPAAALWLAQAVKENGTGHVWTIDDGSEWSLLLQAPACPLLPEERKESHAAFFNDVLDRFGLAPQVTFIPRKVPPFPRIDGKIDLLFSDFLHGPNMILSLLGYFLPRMSRASSILIDSASTAFPSYALLEILIGQLNDGKLPQALLEMTHEDDRAAVTDFVRSSRFTLVHLTETKNRRQNSTTWIKIEPIDLRPHPATAWH